MIREIDKAKSSFLQLQELVKVRFTSLTPSLQSMAGACTSSFLNVHFARQNRCISRGSCKTETRETLEEYLFFSIFGAKLLLQKAISLSLSVFYLHCYTMMHPLKSFTIQETLVGMTLLTQRKSRYKFHRYINRSSTCNVQLQPLVKTFLKAQSTN